jgi:hypothetical protein
MPSRRVWSAGVALLGVLAVLGYRVVFGQFQGYDDEGYLLVTVRQFLEGRPLYDEVYTQYGPAYYLWQWLLHTALGIPTTNDATRVVTLTVWLAACGLVALQVWWLCRRVVPAMAGGAVAFFHLAQLSFEPGHPQELCLLGVLGVLTLTTWRLTTAGHLGDAAALAVGAIVALTALTKPNVGAFLGLAVALGLSTGLAPGRGRAAAMAACTLAAVGAMAALMAADMGRRDIVLFLAVMMSAVASWLVAAWRAPARGVVTLREIGAIVAGTAVAGGAVIGAILATGTSPQGLVDGLLVWPRRMPAIFWFPMPVPLAAAVIAPAWLAFAVGRQRSRQLAHWWLVVARPIGIFALVASLSQRFAALIAGGPPLAWALLSVPSLSDPARVARAVLGIAAVFMAVQIYPMPAGTQSAVATLLLVPVALVLLWDAVAAESATTRSLASSRPAAEQRVVFGSLTAILALVLATNVFRQYARGTPLGLPGATRVHASERDVATYAWLAANVTANCGGFITAPGLNSLHVWTEMPPLTSFNATLWPLLFDQAQQRRVLAAVANADRLCVVWQARRMAALTADAPPPSQPLAAWMERDFVRQAAVGRWEIRTRPGHTLQPAHEARWRDGELDVWAPRVEPGAVVRIAVVDLDAGHVLADSARGDGLAVFDAAGTRLGLSDGLDLSAPRQVRLRGVRPPSAPEAFVILRLWRRDGTLTIVPVVTERQSEASMAEEPYPPAPPE